MGERLVVLVVGQPPSPQTFASHKGIAAFALLRHRLGDVVPASGEAWKESGCALLCVLAAIGLPFTVLSAGSSLIQKWASEQGGGRETYRLYAVSNIGSFVGLLLYPFVQKYFAQGVRIGSLKG